MTIVLVLVVAVVVFASWVADQGVAVGQVPVSSDPYCEVIATAKSIMDGDTFYIDIDRVIDGHTGVEEGDDTVRLAGVNAWELSDTGGEAARHFLENLIPPGTTIYMDLDDNVWRGVRSSATGLGGTL